MKTKTLSILFALVMILSMSVGVFAQDTFDDTWDEIKTITSKTKALCFGFCVISHEFLRRIHAEKWGNFHGTHYE